MKIFFKEGSIFLSMNTSGWFDVKLMITDKTCR